jgi:hypothetical protein
MQSGVRFLMAPASGFPSFGFLIPRPPEADCGITVLRSENPLARRLVIFRQLKLGGERRER